MYSVESNISWQPSYVPDIDSVAVDLLLPEMEIEAESVIDLHTGIELLRPTSWFELMSVGPRGQRGLTNLVSLGLFAGSEFSFVDRQCA